MCGIVGFNWEDRKLLREMTDSLKHRGPDQYGYHTDSNFSLGHRRLSIIDLSEKGKQPLEYKDYLIVHNGEVYNFKDIRDQLRKMGHKFISGTDTEVILHSYAEWGKACLEKFNGMFAFCIYDKKKKELFLARDRLGIKPLYYYFKEGKFIFSSEIKAMAKAIAKKVNFSALNLYFTFRFVPNQETLFENVFRLLPGHYLVFKDQQIKIKQYWDIKFSNNKRPLSYNANKILELLKKSIQRRLISDVPLGIYLSGGLDSSALVALMSEISKKPLNTFTVSFGASKLSEAKYAQIVAKQFSTSHQEIKVSVDAVKIFPEVVKHLDEPIGDAATIPTYLMAQETKKYVTVVLSGEGSDELFAGYEKYKPLYYSRFLPPFPNLLDEGMLGRGNKLFDRDEVRKYLNFVSVFNRKEKNKLFEFPYREDFAWSDYFNTGNELNNLLNLDLKTWLPNDLFLKNDKMTMAHSVEARVPFMDHELVEFCATLPPEQKLRLFKDKYVYRKAVEKILPPQISRRRKQGFTIPLKEWLERGLRDYALELLNSVRIDFLNKEYLEETFQTAEQNLYQRRQFWTLLFFLEWWRQNFK